MIDRLGVPRAFLWLDARPLYAKPQRVHIHFFGDVKITFIEFIVICRDPRNIIVRLHRLSLDIWPIIKLTILVLCLSRTRLGMLKFPYRPLVVRITLYLVRRNRSSPEKLFRKPYGLLLFCHIVLLYH